MIRVVPTILIRHGPSFAPELLSVPSLSLIAWEEPTRTAAHGRSETRQRGVAHSARFCILRISYPKGGICPWVVFGCGAHEIVLFSWAPQWCVLGGVLLSRTLAGAVPSALSGLASGFGMGAGRFPVAVTTETSGLGSVVRWIRLCVVAVTARLRLAWVWCAVCVGWVGCGPYSGRFAVSCCLSRHPYVPSLGRVGWGVLFVSAD